MSGGGSGVGITQVASKAVDIGDSDILAPGQPDLIDHKVAVIGFSVIVNPATNVKALTKAQIQEIFTGKTTNWKDVGGADQKIVFINRPRSSGTRAVFVKTIMGGTAGQRSGARRGRDGNGRHDGEEHAGNGLVCGVFRDAWCLRRDRGFDRRRRPDRRQRGRRQVPVLVVRAHVHQRAAEQGRSRFLAFVTTRRDLLGKLGYIPINDMKVKESDR